MPPSCNVETQHPVTAVLSGASVAATVPPAPEQSCWATAGASNLGADYTHPGNRRHTNTRARADCRVPHHHSCFAAPLECGLRIAGSMNSSGLNVCGKTPAQQQQQRSVGSLGFVSAKLLGSPYPGHCYVFRHWRIFPHSWRDEVHLCKCGLTAAPRSGRHFSSTRDRADAFGAFQGTPDRPTGCAAGRTERATSTCAGADAAMVTALHPAAAVPGMKPACRFHAPRLWPRWDRCAARVKTPSRLCRATKSNAGERFPPRFSGRHGQRRRAMAPIADDGRLFREDRAPSEGAAARDTEWRPDRGPVQQPVPVGRNSGRCRCQVIRRRTTLSAALPPPGHWPVQQPTGSVAAGATETRNRRQYCDGVCRWSRSGAAIWPGPELSAGRALVAYCGARRCDQTVSANFRLGHSSKG